MQLNNTKTQTKLSIVASALLLTTTLALSSPSGGVVKSGSANIVHVDKTTNINQSSNSASINWNTFNIAKDESVNFNQPSSSSITLNRVIGTEKSIISGALNANGQVWILNSNGVLFGKTASINTSGLLATTKEISTDSFKSKDYTLQGNSINSVINDGSINIKSNGYVILAANEVQNSGVIKAIRGRVHLVGANSISINLNGNSLISLTVNKGVLDSLVKNSGDIYADGGEIYLSTNAKNELLKGVVNNTGLIEANSIDDLEGKTYNGKIELFAHGGTAEVGGVINAKDGFVETSGREFSILSDADINAGEWLIDPVNITISDSGGDITPSVIIDALNSGDVTIDATGTGALTTTTGTTATGTTTTTGQDSINVNSPITWSTAHKLTLTADKINVNKPITWSDASGSLNLNATSSVAFDSSITSWTTSNNLFTATSNTATIIINNLFQLQEINTKLSGNYELGSDIDAGDTKDWTDVGSADKVGWKPIGDISTRFTGTFDGKDNTISNLFINRDLENNIGLFGYTDSATIQNIGLVDVDITGKSYVGGLIGYSAGSSITNSYATGAVTGNDTTTALVGGLIGYSRSSSTVTDSYATVIVKGKGQRVGGLIGHNRASSINNSYATGDVEGAEGRIGGLVGISDDSSIITNSYATGAVTGNGTKIGGLMGENIDSIITNSYATGDVSGVDNVGGLIGYISVTSSITNSYATGDVNGVNSVGGLIGYTSDDSSITNSYAIGTVVGTSDVGGLIGLSEGGSTTITNSFYNLDDNAELTYTTIGTGKSLAQFKDIETFNADESSPWDISYTDDTTIPNLDSSYRYPILVKVDDTIYWKIYNGPDPVPTPNPIPTSNPGTDKDKVITSINNGSLTQVKIPDKEILTNTSLTKTADINKDSNSHIVSTPNNQNKIAITLNQIRANRNNTTEDIRIPIEDNSMIELINKGVNLPSSVDQEFYMTENEIEKKKISKE